MPEIFFYVWPHNKPPGTRLLVYRAKPQVQDVAEALRVLDTAYDLMRHRFVMQLGEGNGNAAFCVNPGASFQHSVHGLKSYSEIVNELNTQWLRNRTRLAEALVAV